MFSVPLYIVTLATSAGVVGLFARRVLYAAGFVPDFQTGLILAGGAALFYMALQLVYMAFVRLVTASRGPAAFFAETLSHAAALVLIPFFLGFRVPWPETSSETLTNILDKGEPLVFLGGFVCLHIFFKLLALFGATVSTTGTRAVAFAWVAGAVTCFYGALSCLGLWQEALVEARATSPDGTSPFRSGDTWALARPLQEGRVYTIPLRGHGGRMITFRLGLDKKQELPSDFVNVSVRLGGIDSAPWSRGVRLNPEGWVDFQLPPRLLPLETEEIQIVWSSDDSIPLLAKAGLQPLNMTDREIRLSGPYFHEQRAAAEDPSFIVVLVDGLAGERLRALGGERNTAPRLNSFGDDALSYKYAYTPSPEPAAATMSILTGLVPLAHGYFDKFDGPLPEQVRTLTELLRQRGYATVAFTEGKRDDTLVFDSEFSRGFELFDDSYAPVAAARPATGGLPAGVEPLPSEITLQKASDWIEQHLDQKFFVFIRLSELQNPQELTRYTREFTTGRLITNLDIYDNAIHNVDAQIGLFLDRLSSLDVYDHTCVAFTSSYGHTYKNRDAEPQVRLTEASLHVPLMLKVPGLTRRQRLNLVGLEDIAPTLLNLASLQFSHPVSGESLLEYTSKDRVAIMGTPLVASLRTKRWRFTLETGLQPYSLKRAGEEKVLSMTDIDRYRYGKHEENWFSERRQLGDELRETLLRHLQDFPTPQPNGHTSRVRIEQKDGSPLDRGTIAKFDFATPR